MELPFLFLVLIVFGVLGWFARLWSCFVAVVVMILVVIPARGAVDSYVIICALLALAACYGGNWLMLRWAFAQYRKEDRKNQERYAKGSR